MTNLRRVWRRILATDCRLKIALAINLVFAAAWLWSYGGQTTTIRVEVRGGHLTAFVDGERRLEGDFPISQPSSIAIPRPNARFDVPSLPEGGRIESVRAESLDTGESLIDSGPLARTPPFSNYAIEVEFHNTLEGGLVIEDQSGRTVAVNFRRTGFNALSASASATPAQGEVAQVNATAGVSAVESVRATIAVFLRGYPLALLLALAVATITLTVPALASWDARLPRLRVPARSSAIAAAALAAFVAITVITLMLRYTDARPFVADEVGYLFQARIFASGRTHLSTPPVPEAFQFTYTPFIIDAGGRWASFYTPGHALTLVPGVWVGAPWLIPALVAAANLVLIFAIGRRAYNERTGLFAAALFAVSPFVLMQAASYLSHNTATMYMLAAVLAVISFRDRPLAGGVIGGLCFGMLFLTRPLTAVVITAPLALLLLSNALPPDRRAPEARRIAGFCAAGLAMLAVYFAFNWSMTGDAFQNGYQAGGDLQNAFGFGGAHSVAAGIDNEVFNLAVLAVILNGWPALVGFAFALMPFVLGTRDRMDWFCAVCALSIIASAAFYYTTGAVRGPRYVYEAVPFLLLLTARGIDLLATFGPRLSRATGAQRKSSVSVTGVAVYGFAALLISLSVSGWLLGVTPTWAVPGSPPRPARLPDPFIDGRLVETADDLDPHNAIIVVRPCEPIRQCYLVSFLENDLSLNGDVVWVYDLGASGNNPVFEQYPCRDLYYAEYSPVKIERAGSTPPRSGESCR